MVLLAMTDGEIRRTIDEVDLYPKTFIATSQLLLNSNPGFYDTKPFNCNL
jgi:hypothetical protein